MLLLFSWFLCKINFFLGNGSMQRARIKLSSPDYGRLEEICNQVIDVAERTGVKHSGKIPLPTKILIVPTRKAPCGVGTETYEKWKMKVHKRLIDVENDERTLRRITRIEVPENVHMEIEFKE